MGDAVEPQRTGLVADLKQTVRLAYAAGPRQFRIILLCTAAAACLPALSLIVAKLFVDAVSAAVAGSPQGFTASYEQLVQLLVVQLAISAAMILLSSTSTLSRELLGEDLQNAIRRSIFTKSAALEPAAFERSATHDALRNASAEAGTRPLTVVVQLTTILQSVIILATVSAVISRLGWRVVPLVALAAAPPILVSARFGARYHQILKRRTPFARMQSYVGSLLTSEGAVKDVRSFRAEPYLLHAWSDYRRRFRMEFAAFQRGRVLSMGLASLSSSALIALATLPVLRSAASGSISVGDFSMFLLGINQVQTSIAGLLSSLTGMREHMLYMRNLFEFLDAPSRDLDAGLEWNGEVESIEFKNVSFRYPDAPRDALRDVSFRLRRGERVAIVGRNGAGKTTIVKLLTYLFEPTSGVILLNGQNTRTFSPRSLQRTVSAIFQDFVRYQVNVRDNVTVGHDAGNAERLARATSQAGATALLERLPAGYDTLLGRVFPGGSDLSGGEWQRLALSRMAFKDAPVRVLDEPTAALDGAMERAFADHELSEYSSSLTIIVSHRLSTVMRAQRIIVVDDGSTVDEGSHEELIRRPGPYAALFAPDREPVPSTASR